MNAPFSPLDDGKHLQAKLETKDSSTEIADRTRNKVIETIVSRDQGYMMFGEGDNAEWLTVGVQKVGSRDGVEYVRVRYYASARVITQDVPASEVHMSAIERLEDGSLRMVKPF